DQRVHEAENDAVEKDLRKDPDQELDVHAYAASAEGGDAVDLSAEPVAFSGSPETRPRRPAGRRYFLGAAGGAAVARLAEFVRAPVRRVVAGYLQHEVERLLAVALVVELDVTGDAIGQLGLADGRRDVLTARHLPTLRRGLDALQSDRRGIVGLGRVRLGVLT